MKTIKVVPFFTVTLPIRQKLRMIMKLDCHLSHDPNDPPALIQHEKARNSLGIEKPNAPLQLVVHTYATHSFLYPRLQRAEEMDLAVHFARTIF
jgi:hypothetical protein